MSQNIYSAIDKLYVLAEIVEQFPNRNNETNKIIDQEIIDQEIISINKKINALLANMEKELKKDELQTLAQSIRYDSNVMRAVFPFYWVACLNINPSSDKHTSMSLEP